MKAKQIPGVPWQHSGAYHDTESIKKIVASDLLAQKFEILKERFFSINHWKDYCGKGSADFRLFDSGGSYIERIPQKGDFMRIDIPGPGDIEAKGYDWVEIVLVDDHCSDDELERYLICCRPSKIPGSNTDHIAHFYSRESSSTFVISRGHDFIKTAVYGRNEIPNYKKTGFWGRIRNFLISTGGYTRITKMQWKSYTDGLLDF
ncbi:hypothetical protein [Epilithonimonas hungarica]|uniref:Uncharacterized protein n=1 Tax=Epilithonimonas hungarica TaxID=454006 RepID=A0A1G7TV10_9FLAO|nr:hypothetical protein [Epilithonimonas hungarica]SDG39093.1 hypothetical protein SAMN05421825_3230 [Epilithonimonas hungarica]